MGILDQILGAVQKPQSILTGAYVGGLNTLFGTGNVTGGGEKESEQRRINQMIDDLDAQGVDTSEYQHLKKVDRDTSNLFSGIKSGIQGNLRPSEFLPGQGEEGVGGRILGTALDVGIDPLMLAGPAAKAGNLGNLARGAATAGKLGEEASKGQKVAQLGRQLYQGQLAFGGADPAQFAMGIGAGLLGRQGENALTKLVPAAGRRLAAANQSRASRGEQRAFQALNEGAEEGQLFPGNVKATSAGQAAPEETLRPEMFGYNEPLSRPVSAQIQDLTSGPPALPPAGGTSQGLREAIPMGPAPQHNEDLLRVLQEALPGLRNRGRLSPDDLIAMLREQTRGLTG